MPADREPLDLANQLHQITITVAERALAAETMPQRMSAALEHLDRQGPLTTADLAALAGVRHQSMSATVLDLELKGYVDRRAHPTDVRKVLIELTEDGGEALSQERARRAGWLAEAIAHRVGAEERRQLSESVALLSRLVA